MKKVVRADPVQHRGGLPAGVDQMGLIAVHRFDAERDAQTLGVLRSGGEAAGNVVELGLGGGQAGAFADPAIGHAGQGLGPHRGGLVESEGEKVDPRLGVARGPGAFRQAKRTNGADPGLVEERAGVGGVDHGRVEKGDLDEIEPVADAFGDGVFGGLGRPAHGPDRGMDAETVHGALLRWFGRWHPGQCRRRR